MPRLKLLKGEASWKRHEIESTPLVIGRDKQECSVILRDRAVSTTHATILRNGRDYLLVDHSKNGTKLNNRQLVPGKKYKLQPNDLIQVCAYVLTFRDDDDESTKEESVRLVKDDSSSFSRAVELKTGSWALRKGINSERKLTAIIELTQKLRGCGSLDELLGNALDSLLGLFTQAHRGVVVLEAGNGWPSGVTVARLAAGKAEENAVVSRTVVNEVLQRQAALLAEDESLMGAPLMGANDEPLGALLLDADAIRGQFSQEDLDVLATVAVELGLAVENHILQEVALRQRELEFELKTANEVQIGLLPARPPEIAGYEFFDYYSPARQVGGDYYDYIAGGDGQLAIVVGDVSGKGIPAALLMARVSSELSVHLGSGLGPSETIHRLNPRFVQRNPEGKFVTMLLGVLDCQSHQLVLTNAGHMLPLLRSSDGQVREVGRGKSGFPLGVEPQYRYDEMRLQLHPGDVLVLYSDGVTDARNEVEPYGANRLSAALAAVRGSARDAGEHIISDLHKFVGEAQQYDDICLLCLGRTPP